LAGLVACMGGLKIISSIGQEKGMEGKKVLISLFTTEWKI